MIWLKRTLLLFFASGLLFSARGQKTDKIYLKNGDVITGEIKGMRLAMVTFKMDGPGTISIKWEEVVGFRSDKRFEITLRSGETIVGQADSVFYITHKASLNDIVELAPLKDRFLRRLSGTVNAGFNYAKSSSVTQMNFNGDVDYRIARFESALKVNSVLTNQKSDSSLSKKQDVTFSVIQAIRKRLYIGGSVGWQQNTELGIRNRFLVNALTGTDPLTDNHNRLLFAGGLSYNQEQALESKVYSGNFDALLLVQYKRFYYSTPKLSVNTSIVCYPGLTDWGRVRMEFNVAVSVEVFKDFLIGLNFYDNYDNRPPEGAASKNDFGISFTLGYQFGL